DAARPFVTAAIIDRTLRALENHAGALVAVPVVDTLKRQGKGKAGALVGDTVPRAGLWRAQTPQGFRFAEILAAHKKFAAKDHTDDAALAERAGLEVALVEGSEDNFKVTSEDDLRRAEAMVAPGETRTASGYDVHRFGPGDHVWLCGVKIAHDHGLVGHSDADAPLHALTDALLGTIGAGDIGSHFPPGEAKWKDASSDIFLKHAADLVRGHGGEVLHVDLTIICETPKIRSHHSTMVTRVAEILGLAAGRVSIKATTTEQLGFTGRGEGLAAQALATVRLPG
ncbi:MAG: 2-C-methyl-D-erythritol 2,4-cyclodiphosphate synthase, partial [Alphaproteobacteria bacterium]